MSSKVRWIIRALLGGCALLVAAIPSAGAAVAVVPPPPPALPDWARQEAEPPRKALVIGIGDYATARDLQTPPYDAAAFEAMLRGDLGFSTTAVPQSGTDRPALLLAIRDFVATVSDGDVALVYFSGHGVQSRNVNYLVPRDGQIPERGDEDITFISVDWIWRELAARKPAVVILILDACRTNPFSETDDRTYLKAIAPAASQASAAASDPASSRPTSDPASAHGLAKASPPAQILIAFAAEPDQPAYSLFEGEQASATSIYTRYLVQFLKSEPRPAYEVFGVSAMEVFEKTHEQQRPFLNAFAPTSVMLRGNPYYAAFEDENWAFAAADADPKTQEANLRWFLKRYPASRYARAAKVRLALLEQNDAPNVLDTQRIFTADLEASGLFTGAIRSAPSAGIGSNLGLANRDIVVRSAPSNIFSRALARLSVDDPVRVLASRGDGWAEVVAPDGSRGWIGRVRESAQEAPSYAATVDYAPGRPQDRAAATWSEPPPASALLRDRAAIATIRVGPVSRVEDSLAAPERLLRAMRLRQTLLNAGLAADRVILDPDAQDVEPDKAVVSLFGAGSAP